MAHIDENGKLIYNEITDTSVIQANYLRRRDGKAVDDAISITTGLMPWNWGTPPISHDEIGFWVDCELWFFSSTSRKELGSGVEGKKNGTRWNKASELFRHPERWLLQEKKVNMIGWTHAIMPDEIIDTKINRANALIGAEYDFPGVFTDWVNPARLSSNKPIPVSEIIKIKKIYCSKTVHLVDTGKLYIVSPRQRYRVAEKSGYKTIPDTKMFLHERGAILDD